LTILIIGDYRRLLKMTMESAVCISYSFGRQSSVLTKWKIGVFINGRIVGADKEW